MAGQRALRSQEQPDLLQVLFQGEETWGEQTQAPTDYGGKCESKTNSSSRALIYFTQSQGKIPETCDNASVGVIFPDTYHTLVELIEHYRMTCFVNN